MYKYKTAENIKENVVFSNLEALDNETRDGMTLMRYVAIHKKSLLLKIKSDNVYRF